MTIYYFLPPSNITSRIILEFSVLCPTAIIPTEIKTVAYCFSCSLPIRQKKKKKDSNLLKAMSGSLGISFQHY